jgi:SAM-dependent methyltransferase
MRHEPPRDAYVSFWDDVGTNFPSLKGAASTAYYFECERILHQEFFPRLSGKVLLKTDLWDEAKNTEILLWAAAHGARPVGVDIAYSTVRQAKEILKAYDPGCVVGDVRALPFRAGSIDLVYSMGTIEHFPDYHTAVEEIFRVLKPGGTAIIGVPNKHDPFLRPTLVALMQIVNRYPYGDERAFTLPELRRLLEGRGFCVTAHTGILFIPGWLRIVDLWCHVRAPALARLTGWFIRPFAWLYRRVPGVRRHGYLIACVAQKPEAPP